jgi:hypothetical protein
MGLPYTGGQMRRVAQPYSGAQVWGTGINDIHQYYGSPPVRLNDSEYPQTPPSESRPQATDIYYNWEYGEPASNGARYVTYDDRPGYDVSPQDSPVRRSVLGHPPVNATGAAKQRFRRAKGGAHRLMQVLQPTLPSETVSEGWTNKTRGALANSKPSDPSQYEMQTSMTQRYKVRGNQASVARATDEPRATIQSRVAGQKVKNWSQGERNYDMLPKAQDDMPRPFYYRTAGTGDPAMMNPNEMYNIDPIQRTVPPDPSLGNPDDNYTAYGYTPEDNFYA